jgi:hypothetical protein
MAKNEVLSVLAGTLRIAGPGHAHIPNSRLFVALSKPSPAATMADCIAGLRLNATSWGATDDTAFVGHGVLLPSAHTCNKWKKWVRAALSNRDALER